MKIKKPKIGNIFCKNFISKKPILIYNQSFDKNSIYYDDEIYIRLKNIMKKWNIKIEDSVNLLLNFELQQNQNNLSFNESLKLRKHILKMYKIILDEQNKNQLLIV